MTVVLRPAPDDGSDDPGHHPAPCLAVLLGGRAFPGWHHRARFNVEEGDGSFLVEMTSRDGEVKLAVCADRSEEVMPGSVLGSIEEAPAFFGEAPLGYSATPTDGAFDGVSLRTAAWSMSPLQLDEVR